MRINTILLLSFLCLSLKAQFLHTPSQIETIKRESMIKYHLDSVVPEKEQKAPKLLTFAYETTAKGDTSLIQSISADLSNKELKYIKKGDQHYADRKYKQAVNQYLKSKKVSQISEVMARTAFCYQQTGQSKEAIIIYKKLLATDTCNAYLYFQLANCYSQKGKYQIAARQITLAHLYNRNNSTYLDTLSSIYQRQNLKFRTLDFNPKYEIKSSGNQVHIMASTDPWIAYASVKAVWIHEPDYQDKMNSISSEDSRIIEEKECLFNALVAYEQLDAIEKINYPGLYTLSSALPEKRVNDFIMYEISLPEYPEIARQLSEERLDSLIDYIYKYRVKIPDVSQ